MISLNEPRYSLGSQLGKFKETDKSKSTKFEISQQENIDCEGWELSELSIIKTYWKEDSIPLKERFASVELWLG